MTDDTYTDADKHLLGGRYQVGQRVGGGRMTDVYRATDTVLGKTVAIKILNEDIAEDDEFAQRFVREAKAFAADDADPADTTHPALVSILDAGTDEGQHYVVMEFVRGRTLAEVIRERGALGPERAMEITEAVCRGLTFAHKHGVIHRDITPSNILMGDDDSIKLMDAGIARPTSATTAAQTAAMLGSAHYISPELARGGEPFARSDIYSLGIVLYEMLTGRPPFPGESPVAVAMQHVRETPKRPVEIDPAIGQPLSDITMKALSKNPGERYGSPDELRLDLEKLHAAEAIATEDTPTTQVIPSTIGADTMLFTSDAASNERRLNPKVLIGIGIGVLVVAIAVFFMFLRTTNVEIPNLIGQNISTATTTLESLGLEVTTIDQASPDGTNIGKVVDQAPDPLTIVPEGATITLTVSTPLDTVLVPDLVNSTEGGATSTLRNLGLSIGTIDTQPSATPAGLVTAQDPPAGTEVEPGSVVSITVSAGQSTVTVPSVTCLKVNDAAIQLDQAGLQMTIAGTEANSLCQGGARIARQDSSRRHRIGPRLDHLRMVHRGSVAGRQPLTGHLPQPFAAGSLAPSASDGPLVRPRRVHRRRTRAAVALLHRTRRSRLRADQPARSRQGSAVRPLFPNAEVAAPPLPRRVRRTGGSRRSCRRRRTRR